VLQVSGAVYCSLSQSVAICVFCSVLQVTGKESVCIAGGGKGVCCSVFQRVAASCNLGVFILLVAEKEFVEGGELEVYCSVSQQVAACCSVCEWRNRSEACCNVTSGGNKVY